MKKQSICTRVVMILGSLLITTAVFAQNPDFHIYLCFGQSNMEGAAPIEAQDRVVDSRFQVMQSVDCADMGKIKGAWYPAVPPLVRCNTGLSPADYFGRTMVATLPENIKVGVINVAIGGCDIRLFDKDLYLDYDSAYGQWFTDIIKGYGGSPYEHLIELAKLAQQDGVIKGVLLHQGETNQGDEKWPSYVKKVYEDMLSDLSLNADKVPLLAGEMLRAEQGGRCAGMNPIVATLPQFVTTAHVISSKGCPAKDGAHFNAEGYRKLGRRYAETMLSLQGYDDVNYKPKLPLKNANDSLVSTEVLSGNRVAFRIYAPEAGSVILSSMDGGRVEMKKDYRGVWEGIMPDVKDGAYRYLFVVDGVPVYDPRSALALETNALFVKSSEEDFFTMKEDVPHGAISQRYYYSETLEETRRFHIWTPAGVETSKRKLPVLYLIHGGMDFDNAWTTIGCAGNILDNLYAEGKVEPMMVVMPNATLKAGYDFLHELLIPKIPVFTEDLVKGIIPFVESNYNVYTDGNHRAIMGLSLGGLQTLDAMISYPDDFAYVGVLSSGWWITEKYGKRRAESDDKEYRAAQLKEIAADFNKSNRLLYFTEGGPEDHAYENGMETMKLFDAAGIKYQYSEKPGGHTWMVWRQDLRDLAPLLFK